MNKKYIPFVILAVLTVVLLLSPVCRMYIHALTNIVIGGRSTMKLFALIVYICILFFLFIYKDKIKTHSSVLKYFMYSLCALFGMSIFMMLMYAYRYGISLTDFSILFNNGEISSTVLSHTHVTKGAIGTILSSFGITYLENVDGGHAFIGILPKLFFIIEILLIGIATLLSFSVFVHKIKQGVSNVYVYTIAYGILAFSILERSFDGGFFDIKTPLTIAALLLLIYGYTKRTKIVACCIGSVSFIVFFIYAYKGMLGDSVSVWTSVWQLCALTLFLITVLYVAHKGITRLGVLLCILLCIGAYPAFTDYSSDALYRNLPLTKGTYIALITEPKYQGLIPVQKINDLTLYTVSENEKGYVSDVIDKEGLVLSMHPIAIPWKTCFPNAPFNTYVFTITSKEKIEILSVKESLYTYEIKQSGMYNEYYVYEMTLSFDQCTPRTLNVIEYILYSQGLTEFVISNIKTPQYDLHS